LNSKSRHFSGYTTFILVSFGESRLLVLWCTDGKCGLVDSDEVGGRSRRPGVEDQGWSSTGRVLGGQMIGRSDDAMCGLHQA
jgi:hypothetical protein